MSPTRCETDFTVLLPRLRRRARALCACPAEADDLAQDCALRLWMRLSTGVRIEDPEAYAMTLLRHRWISLWRARREEACLEETDARCAPDFLDRLTLDEVRAAIGALPAPQARVLACVLEGETSPAAISRRLDVPKGTVMSRLARARAALRLACPDWRA